MPKRAVLGFKYLSLDDELMVPTSKELVHSVESMERNSRRRHRESKLRWWHRNKEKYNLRRRAVACSIETRYKEAERRAIQKSDGWEFSPEEWEHAWETAGSILIPGSQTPQNPEGDVVPAFALRGSHSLRNTCMKRIDTDAPWSVDNYVIMFRGEPLGPGSKWYRE